MCCFNETRNASMKKSMFKNPLKQIQCMFPTFFRLKVYTGYLLAHTLGRKDLVCVAKYEIFYYYCYWIIE